MTFAAVLRLRLELQKCGSFTVGVSATGGFNGSDLADTSGA
jgi:hypothetical protein